MKGHQSRRRALTWAAAAAIAVLGALSGPLGSRAEQVDGFGGCEWANGPTVPDTGCSYTAFAFVGSVEWVEGTGPALVTGSPAAISPPPTCAFLGNVGGVCAYLQAPGDGVTVSVPGSTAGAAGTGPEPVIKFEPASCVWVPLTGGCKYVIDIAVGTLTGNVVYAGVENAPPPSITGVTSSSCTPLTTTSGTCTFTASTPTTVSISADVLSAGIAVSHTAL